MKLRCLLLGHDMAPELKAEEDRSRKKRSGIIIVSVVERNGMRIRKEVTLLSP